MLLKKSHLRRVPARSPSRGRAKSCSLFVATAPLILPRVKAWGRLIAAYIKVRLRPQDCLPNGRERIAGALHPDIFEQPEEIEFFRNLLVFIQWFNRSDGVREASVLFVAFLLPMALPSSAVALFFHSGLR